MDILGADRSILHDSTIYTILTTITGDLHLNSLGDQQPANGTELFVGNYIELLSKEIAVKGKASRWQDPAQFGGVSGHLCHT